MPSLVSLCMPSRNTRPFLDSRMDSIMSQSMTDWELIIVDDGSTDGSWEFFKDWQSRDTRIKLFHGPRQGLYPGWNDAIRRANGEFVYIATSDDSMAPDCLEKLVAALQTHPSCSLAHCTLRVIDEHDNDSRCDWYSNGPFLKSTGNLASKRHIRSAPFDGLLHLTGASVYASMTQLLIRRTVFDSIGLFKPDWGPMGDFNWNMRASLAFSTVHVPDTWGGWRLHSGQATAKADKLNFYQNTQEMIDHAVDVSLPFLPTAIHKPLLKSWKHYFNARRFWWEDQPETKKTPKTKLARLRTVLRKLGTGNPVARDYFLWKLGLSDDFVAEPSQLVERWYRRFELGAPFSIERTTSSQ